MQDIISKRILVTGGSGFIGTNLIEYLSSKSAQVFNFDIVPPRNPLHSQYFTKIDIRDLQSLQLKIEEIRPDYVIHLAARTDLGGSTLEDYSANIEGVKNICHALCKTDSVKRVIFASSMLVCKAGYIPSSNTDYCPTTVYGHSKVRSEEIIRSYHSDLPSYCIVRPTSIWGPWFSAPYKDFFDMVLSGRYVNLGKRSCTKTYGFVSNAVSQLLHLTFNVDDSNSVFYIGDSKPIKISSWASLISNLAGRGVVRTLPYVVFKLAAYVGDILVKSGFKFPMTSFRLKNMTTDNVIPSEYLAPLGEFKSIGIEQGVELTLGWIKKSKSLKV